MRRRQATQTLTINVDRVALTRARIRALQQGTSVNEVLARTIEEFAGQRAVRTDPVDRLVAIREGARRRRGSAPADRAPRYRRDDLYER